MPAVPARPVAAEPCEVVILDPVLLEAEFQLLAGEMGVSGRREPSDIHHVLDLVRPEHVQEFAHAPRTRPDRPDLHLLHGRARTKRERFNHNLRSSSLSRGA